MTTQNTFIPMPPGLPTLPEVNTATNWWAYHAPKHAGDMTSGNDWWACENGSKEWYRGSQSPYGAPFGDNDHYIELIPIDYADPAYREYIQDAFAKGAKIEANIICQSDGWKPCASPLFSWKYNQYRIAQPAPEKACEPDYFSEEYQVELFRRWRKEFFDLEEWRVGEHWEHPRNEHWEQGLFYREKPTPQEPVMVQVPLDDFKVGECIKAWGYLYVISQTDTSENVLLECSKKIDGWNGSGHLMTTGAKIHRNGAWQPCSKTVERKG